MTLTKSDQAKVEILLISLPFFYKTLVENLRTKAGYTYEISLDKHTYTSLAGKMEIRKKRGQKMS